MYAKGLGFAVLAEFEDHRGFDGVILGHPRQPYHIEFTSQRGHKVGKAPTPGSSAGLLRSRQEPVGSRACPNDISRISRGAIIQRVLGHVVQDVLRYRWLSRGVAECAVDRVRWLGARGHQIRRAEFR